MALFFSGAVFGNPGLFGTIYHAVDEQNDPVLVLVSPEAAAAQTEASIMKAAQVKHGAGDYAASGTISIMPSDFY